MESTHGLWPNSAYRRCRVFMDRFLLAADLGRFRGGAGHQLAGGGDDRVRVDARRGQLLGGRCRARHVAYREPDDARLRLAGEDLEHRVAEPALRPVVSAVTSRPVSAPAWRSVTSSIGLMLYRSITWADAVRGQPFGGRDGLVEGDARADQGDLVVGGPRTTRAPPIGNDSPGG